jgi:hypothetical protein
VIQAASITRMLHADFFPDLLFNPEDRGDIFLRLSVNSTISHKIELFITSTMRTSNPKDI